VLIWQGGARSKKKDVGDKLRKALDLAVDEKVPETVKRPRRATVAGAPEELPGVPPVGTTAFQKDVLESVTEGPESPEEHHKGLRKFSL
jgi:hypothetical protein